MFNTDKDAARVTGLVMLVVAAVLQLLNIAVTPEDMEALEVIINVTILAFVTMGGAEFIRSKVASRDTVARKTGEMTARKLFNDRR